MISDAALLVVYSD